MEGEAISQKYRELLERIVLQDPARSEFIGRGVSGGARGPSKYSKKKCLAEKKKGDALCKSQFDDCFKKVEELKTSLRKAEGAGISGGARKMGPKRPTKRVCAQNRKSCRQNVKSKYESCINEVQSKHKMTYRDVLNKYRREHPNVSYKKAQQAASNIYQNLPKNKIIKKSVATKKRKLPSALKQFNEAVADYRMENPGISYREAQQEVKQALDLIKYS